jgi:hypothetical protein
MGTVFVNIGLSLDGYMAPEGMTMAHGRAPITSSGARSGVR